MKRFARRRLMFAWIVLLFVALESCSGNPSVSTNVGIHRSPSGDWGHSLSIGIHSHGGRW